ncbi:hypothetical protein [Arthrobacter sp. Y-9]|uniref:hypothetical protein n=1 Tax=Arthrobacter sp. Y-9 TaxID=3039385 RepID=UPI00241FCEC1|nr:hypothetical protein [Arthrobacter sp. Y-9]WFR83207.1 hypothetical protein P9849_11655 [Arthrobacter sp. Y-9]
MKKTSLWPALALVPLLAACAPTIPLPAPASSQPSESATTPVDGSSPSDSAGSPSASTGALSLKEGCEKFNSLDEKLAGLQPTDKKGLLDLWDEFDRASDAVPYDLQGLYKSMSIVVLAYQGKAAGEGDGPSKQDKDLVSQHFLRASGLCSPEGVTLTLKVL